MDLELLKKENVIGLFNEYQQGNDLYPFLVGGDSEQQVSDIDREKQKNFISWITKQNAIIFGDGESPDDSFNNDSPFCHVCSKEFDRDRVAHRLYFNLGDYKMDFVSLFVRLCHLNNLPCYVKFNKSVSRTDDVVVYIEEDKVKETADVLMKVAERVPQFTEEEEIPMATVDGGWFGYAPENTEDHSKSFNRRVANCVESAFKDPSIINENRGAVRLNSVSQLSDTLYKRYIDKRVLAGESYEDVIASSPSREAFAQNALRMALKFFGESEGSGFVDFDRVTSKDYEERKKEISQQIAYTIIDPKTGASAELSAELIMEALYEMVKNNEAKFEPNELEKVKMCDAFEENIKNELYNEFAKDNFDFTLPNELQGLKDMNNLSHNQVKKRDDEGDNTPDF